MSNKNKPKLLVFASGSKDGGGSGFENLVLASRSGVLHADIVAVVSNYLDGGVRRRADRLGVPFIHFAGPYVAEEYRALVERTKADFVSLSGWLKPVRGLDSRRTINIHPGPLPRFGGSGMYGHHVHEAVLAAFHRREIAHTEVCMHFVTEGYDEGPVFFRSLPIKILPADTPETLAKRVNEVEHRIQPSGTNLVMDGQIVWDGVSKENLEL